MPKALITATLAVLQTTLKVEVVTEVFVKEAVTAEVASMKVDVVASTEAAVAKAIVAKAVAASEADVAASTEVAVVKAVVDEMVLAAEAIAITVASIEVDADKIAAATAVIVLTTEHKVIAAKAVIVEVDGAEAAVDS